MAVAAVVVLIVGALSTGIVKLPGGLAGPDSSGPPVASDASSAAPGAPIESPPPIDHLATALTGALTLGDSSPVKAIQLGADGASATVSAPGKPWDGFKFDIPAGAWPGSTLQVSAQPIEASTFGDLVTPISPLYTVSGAEGMAPTPVTLTIPATIPDDSFAMGFFYDGLGHLEGMPLLAEDGTSVTIATQHFSSFFASLVKKALLPKEIDSGFRPGKDDWQFVNRGSNVAPNGQCAGQVLTEAWYYIERQQKGTGSPLYGTFDNNGGQPTRSLWEDDSYGYRLASVAQTQYEADWKANGTSRFFPEWRTSHADGLQYDAFRYAIAITGEPQLMQIWDAQDSSSHAILAYRVAPSAIFVADPNYPAGLKYVPFDGPSATFGTFQSGLNWKEIAAGNATTYTNFAYIAKSSMVDWPSLAADWAAFDAGTIGNGVFPAYALQALAGKDLGGQDVWVPLVDGYRTSEKQLTVRMLDPKGTDYMQMDIYRGTNPDFEKSVSGLSADLQIELTDGDNPLGIYEEGATPASPTDPVTTAYVDFVRLNVILEPAASPSPATGGHWVLTATTPLYGGAGKSWHSDFESLVVDSTNGRISSTWDTAGPPKEHVETSVSWGTPPPTSAPGGVWITSLTAEAPVCRGDDLAMDFAFTSVTAHVNWYAGAQDPRHDEWTASVTCNQAKASTKLTWTFPDFHGLGADFFDIVVQGAGYNEDTWTYSYQWRP